MTVLLEQTVSPQTCQLGDVSRAVERADLVAVEFGDGSRAELPAEMAELFASIVRTLASGKAVTVGAVNQTLTTQEAADLLEVSRPTLVKYLDEGRIASTRPGTHRRIQLSDVIEFQATLRKERRAILRQMSQDSQAEQGFGGGFVATR